MTDSSFSPIEARGFHFHRDGMKWLVKGVTYGPFRPDGNGDAFPSPGQIARDLDQMVLAGVNTVRVYTNPTDQLIDLAMERGLYILVDVPWPKHIDVYGKERLERMCLEMVEEGINRSKGRGNILGVMIGNEIPPDLARWATPERVESFLKRLYLHAKSLDADRLVGFANFPSTEYLDLGFFDFLGFNVYLENEAALRDYLFRLRHLYPDTPLLLSETGMDSLGNGEVRQAEVLDFSIRVAHQAGMAGTLVFSWTDEWHTGGYDINDWKFGILDKDRNPKPAFGVIMRHYESAPQCTQLPDTPKISVVVASYNGGATLRECLHSLGKVNYPDFEVIVIDDGSTDNTPDILKDFPWVHIHTQENRGLSVARNMGIELAQGEIIAFTDSDCVADPDWLYFIALTMLSNDCAGVGGPNLTPWETRPMHRSVAYAPGHATHVLLDGHEAEHVPGCNMAFWRSDLVAVGCFDPVYRKAGDDVDVIWRLQENGGRILFSPAAFVWHHRRSTVSAYLRQQMGYGEAEALLAFKHPHRFNDRWQSLWRGVIYSSQEVLPLSRTHDIHYGVFGSAGFQCIYERKGGFASYFVTSLEWWLVCLLLLACGLISSAAFFAGVLGILVSVSVSGLKARRQFRKATDIAGRHFMMVWLLWLLQPLYRGWKRYAGIFLGGPVAGRRGYSVPIEKGEARKLPVRLQLDRQYWNEEAPDRLAVLRAIADAMTKKSWLYSPNTGWEPWDMSIILSQWFRSRLITAEEDHGAGRKLFKYRLSIVPTSLFLLLSTSGIVASLLIALQDTVVARALLMFVIVMGWILYRRAMKAQATVAALCERVLVEMGFFNISKQDAIETSERLSGKEEMDGMNREESLEVRS